MTPRLFFLVGIAANVLAQSVLVDETQNQQYVLNSQKPNFNPPMGHLRRFELKDSDMLSHVLGLAEKNDLDLWQVAQSHVDIYSPPSVPELPISLLELPHSSRNITIDARSLSTKSLAESVEDWNLPSLANTTYHSDYHPLFEIEAFINRLAALYPNTTQLHRLGHSGQGREMVSLTISKGLGTEKKERGMNRRQPEPYSKPAFVIMGAQHAREWVATATSLYLAHALTSDASEPHGLSSLLNIFDFHIIPSPNPDGYDYTWESDRFWYKTRQNLGPKSRCLGLDMNRNWGYKWKSRAPSPVGASVRAKRPDPCSTWYPGHRPFQAPEVNNIANWISTLPHLVGFIGLRSYGQMLSSPYSYSCKKIPKDAEDQMEAGFGAARAMQSTHGTAIMTGTLCEMLYRAPGNIVDWMYKRAGIKYSYVVHLRDTGTYGFSLPSKWIRPVGEETGEMVQYLAKFIARKMNKDFC